MSNWEEEDYQVMKKPVKFITPRSLEVAKNLDKRITFSYIFTIPKRAPAELPGRLFLFTADGFQVFGKEAISPVLKRKPRWWVSDMFLLFFKPQKLGKKPIWHVCQGLNSHYFHIIEDGHQPNSRGLYTHYKDSY